MWVKAFAGKPVTAIESIGAVTAFGGLMLFVLPKLQGHHSDLTAYLMGLSFALFSAAISLSYVSLFKSYAMTQPLLNPVPVAFLTLAIGSVIITPMMLSTTPHWNLLFQPRTVAIAIALGIGSTVIPTVCSSYAAKHLSPILTTALNLMTPIFASAISVLLLKEQFPFLSFIGAALMITGILLLSSPHSHTAEN
jgi:drug/metabolite transporter, DME family